MRLGRDLVVEGFVCSRTLDELVAACGLGGLTGHVDVVFFETDIVEGFENIERSDIVASVDERLGEVTTNKV